MNCAKKDYPFDNSTARMPTKNELLYRDAFHESSVYHYNKDLESFYQTYEFDYLPQLHAWKIAQMLSIEFSLEIYNDGNIPAEDIDLIINFPNGIIVQTADNFNPFPDVPIAPLKPRSLYKLTEELNELRKKGPVQPVPAPAKPQHWICIKNYDGYQVDMKHNNLKHNQTFKFTRFTVNFENLDYRRGFEFEYKLMIANVPDLKTGKLQVSFDQPKNFPTGFIFDGKRFVLSIPPK